jgi:proline racemase
MSGEFVDSVRLFNVASYLHSADVVVEVPGVGSFTVDIAYGGNFYAVVEPQESWAGGGWAQITGHNTIFVDDKDPLRHGFQLA